MILQIILKALSSVALKVIATVGTADLIEWLMFKTAQVVTDSTKTPHDDEFLKKFKELYEKPKN